MTEMILVIPFLMLILAFVFYFGRGMVRVQRAQLMDRYEVWRDVANAPGPKWTDPESLPNGPLLNDTFFAGNAESVEKIGSNFFPDDAPDELIDEAQNFSNGTSELVEESHDAFPRGRSVNLTTDHEETIPLWKQFDGPIRHRHTRLENDWRHVNGWTGDGPDAEYAGGGPWMLPEVRDVFLESLDGPLENMIDGTDNPLARAIRNTSLNKPGYGGPEIDISGD